MNVYLHKPADGSMALYIDGNLQFDSRDEAVYHESLALPALCLAHEPRNVLICGGGDGLALREVLRFPGIEQVLLIDCSPEILCLARTEFAEMNDHALADPRVSVVVADALEYPLEQDAFDVILVDFTFPTTTESALGFTVEWYGKLKAAMRPTGILAINGVSPQNTATAFACLVATVSAAGIKPTPYRVCIPSFRDHGYGAWGFILAGNRRITLKEMEEIHCPVPTRQADIAKFTKGAHFSATERLGFATAPANRAGRPVLQRLLLNPGIRPGQPEFELPPDFPNLVRQVDVSHPYHSRTMIETLAEHVAGSLKSIDLRKLVEELTARAKRLPERIRQELAILRDYLSRTVLDLDLWGTWAARLFATLLIVMTVANSISPDQAFAKGAEGIGHSSFSRGLGGDASAGMEVGRPNAPISGRGFRTGYGLGPVDVYGYAYPPRSYLYVGYGSGVYGNYGGYGNGGNTTGAQPSRPETHKPLFVLDDDLIAMDNGDFVIPLCDTVFLVLSNGTANLCDAKTGKILTPIFADPKLFDSIHREVASQGADLDREVKVRRDWLSWVGWSSALFSSVGQDNQEYLNLQDLQRRLGLATKKLGNSSEKGSLQLEPDAVELFVGCHILPDNTIAIYEPGGMILISDGATIGFKSGSKTPLNPQLKAAIAAILQKMITESQKDLVSDSSQYESLTKDQAASNNDLNQYNGIKEQNQNDPTYEVDYGTDSLPVSDAISRTVADLASIGTDMQALQVNYKKTQSDLARFQSALQAWGT